MDREISGWKFDKAFLVAYMYSCIRKLSWQDAAFSSMHNVIDADDGGAILVLY